MASSTIDDLYAILYAGPAYAYYVDSTANSAHLVVVTGVDKRNDIVYTNNPWGVAGQQSYSDFSSGFVNSNGQTVQNYQLYSVFEIQW